MSNKIMIVFCEREVNVLCFFSNANKFKVDSLQISFMKMFRRLNIFTISSTKHASKRKKHHLFWTNYVIIKTFY